MLEKFSCILIRYKYPLMGMTLVLAVVFPFLFKSQYVIRIATIALMYVILALSLNMLSGMLGQMSFGHAAFFGIGAYTAAILCTKMGLPSQVTLPAAVLMSGLFGVFLGMPVLRLNGYYFTIVTMVFCEIIRIVELNWMSVTRGPLGIMAIKKPEFFGFEIKSQTQLYLFILACVIVCGVIVHNIMNSRIGNAVLAIRDDELAAESMGIHVFKYKVMIFVISSMMAGLAGAFYAQYTGYIDPTNFASTKSNEMLVMVIFGGLGSTFGSFLGAIVLSVIPELLRSFSLYRQLIYGVLLVVLISVREWHGRLIQIQEGMAMSQVLNVKNLTQRFGGLVALEHVDMCVNEGEIVGIIGPNGAGKSTLFNCITGIYNPTEGRVEMLGKDITGWKPYKVTELGFARTFQNIRLFRRMTVLDNVLIGMHTRTKTNLLTAIFNTRAKRKEMEECEKKAVDLLRLFERQDLRYEMATSLPYGSQRDLEIARALASNPRLLLLDEPAAGMNESETETLRLTIGELKRQGYTVLLIEHDMKFVMNICERIYVLDNGRLIGSGTPSEVKANPAVVEAYLGKE